MKKKKNRLLICVVTDRRLVLVHSFMGRCFEFKGINLEFGAPTLYHKKKRNCSKKWMEQYPKGIMSPVPQV